MFVTNFAGWGKRSLPKSCLAKNARAEMYNGNNARQARVVCAMARPRKALEEVATFSSRVAAAWHGREGEAGEIMPCLFL